MERAAAHQPAYREWRPADGLARHVLCSWAGRVGADGTPFAERVMPDGCVDVIWDGARLFVAGPDTGPVEISPGPGGGYAGVRFRPGLAPTLLGLPASELLDQRVDAGGVPGFAPAGVGRHAMDLGQLTERLHQAASLRQAAQLLEAALLESLPGAGRPDPVVEAAVAMLIGDGGAPASLPPVAPGPPVGRLAGELGVSERQLHRRTTAAVGYGPKTLGRVLRFRRFLALATRQPATGLADLAAAAGYADQAHLTRECTRLGGAPPARLLGRRLDPA